MSAPPWWRETPSTATTERPCTRRPPRPSGPYSTSWPSSPEANLLPELEQLFSTYGSTGAGEVCGDFHDNEDDHRGVGGTFGDWQPLPEGTDLLYYEGLHGGYVDERIDIARHADLSVGVVPIINLEWIQKIHRDRTTRGHSDEAIVATILRRMPDYIDHICPQFSRTDVNFQRVPHVDTSNPFIARHIPTLDESTLVIRFRDPHGIDFSLPAGDAPRLVHVAARTRSSSPAGRWSWRCN